MGPTGFSTDGEHGRSHQRRRNGVVDGLEGADAGYVSMARKVAFMLARAWDLASSTPGIRSTAIREFMRPLSATDALPPPYNSASVWVQFRHGLTNITYSTSNSSNTVRLSTDIDINTRNWLGFVLLASLTSTNTPLSSSICRPTAQVRQERWPPPSRGWCGRRLTHMVRSGAHDQSKIRMRATSSTLWVVAHAGSRCAKKTASSSFAAGLRGVDRPSCQPCARRRRRWWWWAVLHTDDHSGGPRSVRSTIRGPREDLLCADGGGAVRAIDSRGPYRRQGRQVNDPAGVGCLQGRRRFRPEPRGIVLGLREISEASTVR